MLPYASHDKRRAVTCKKGGNKKTREWGRDASILGIYVKKNQSNTWEATLK